MAIATLDWSQCPAVESVPGRRSGAWVFKDTRMPVSAVFENLQDMSVDELVEEFGVTRETGAGGVAARRAQHRSTSPPALMLVLFDRGTPRTLARYLIDHQDLAKGSALEIPTARLSRNRYM